MKGMPKVGQMPQGRAGVPSAPFSLQAPLFRAPHGLLCKHSHRSERGTRRGDRDRGDFWLCGLPASSSNTPATPWFLGFSGIKNKSRLVNSLSMSDSTTTILSNVTEHKKKKKKKLLRKVLSVATSDRGLPRLHLEGAPRTLRDPVPACSSSPSSSPSALHPTLCHTLTALSVPLPPLCPK